MKGKVFFYTEYRIIFLQVQYKSNFRAAFLLDWYDAANMASREINKYL